MFQQSRRTGKGKKDLEEHHLQKETSLKKQIAQALSGVKLLKTDISKKKDERSLRLELQQELERLD